MHDSVSLALPDIDAVPSMQNGSDLLLFFKMLLLT